MKNTNDIADTQAGSLQIDKNTAAYKRLLETIRILRAEGGCPWDREQTPLSMRQELIEDCFEAADAISEQADVHTKEELGEVSLTASRMA